MTRRAPTARARRSPHCNRCCPARSPRRTVGHARGRSHWAVHCISRRLRAPPPTMANPVEPRPLAPERPSTVRTFERQLSVIARANAVGVSGSAGRSCGRSAIVTGISSVSGTAVIRIDERLNASYRRRRREHVSYGRSSPASASGAGRTAAAQPADVLAGASLPADAALVVKFDASAFALITGASTSCRAATRSRAEERGGARRRQRGDGRCRIVAAAPPPASRRTPLTRSSPATSRWLCLVRRAAAGAASAPDLLHMRLAHVRVRASMNCVGSRNVYRPSRARQPEFTDPDGDEGVWPRQINFGFSAERVS